jgi:hypothetical protein
MEGHEGLHNLSDHRIELADDPSFDQGRMFDQSALNLE